jgi:hypothetical protein
VKREVVEQLGETALLLPELINRGLAANDRLKYYLTLLQAAITHAAQPQQPFSPLRAEREACGISDPAFDDLVGHASRQADGLVSVPALRTVRTLLLADLETMIRPIASAAGEAGAGPSVAATFRQRLQALEAALPIWDHDLVDPDDVAALTRVGDASRDTVHQLVMDMHRELNRLQAAVASESIDGARTYALTDGDRELVRAFMSGVNQTAGLKFDHPGLGTTATTVGDRLSIQNDIGTTDAHVIVITVTGLTVTIVYTDIHRRRGAFLRELLSAAGVEWEPRTSRGDDSYEMSVGQFTASERPGVEQFLTRLGSRLVFLIDWNKARKRLSRLVRKRDAIAVLRWAADNNVGHRAFLQAGDLRLIYTALERSARAQTRYGARLDELLGREAARLFLTAVLRITAEGLIQHRSIRLIQDEIEAELLTHLQTTERSTLTMAAEHAAIVGTLADRLRQTLMRVASGQHGARVERAAVVAKAWETRADELVIRACRVRDQSPGTNLLARLIVTADEVADALEEIAFLLTLIPDHADGRGLGALGELADLVTRSTKEYVRCLEGARNLPREAARSDVQDVLVAIDRLVQLEHEVDAAERAAKARVIETSHDFRELYVLSAVAHAFEEASDALARCSHRIRDYVLSGVSVPS